MRYQGKITSWKDEQGFGFITPNGGGEKIFVHIKSFRNRKIRPSENLIVTYELGLNGKGQAQAEQVSYIRDPLPGAAASRGPGDASLVLAVAFLLFVSGAAFAGGLPMAVPALYLVASAAAFSVYAADKSAAKKDQRRTPERTLHLLALAGGWPGALAAQKLLRHKSRKRSFQIVFWITAILNGCALAWSISPAGRSMLLSIRSLA